LDTNGQPNEIVESIVPVWNSLIFFEVTPASFHQVSEVLAPDKERITIGGWFHGKPTKRPPRYKEAQLEKCPFVEADVPLEKWINSKYLNGDHQKEIQLYFQDHCSIELLDFLLEERYDELAESLSTQKWELIGPANRRHYSTLGRFGKGNRAEGIVAEFIRLLQSNVFAKFVQAATRLEPHQSFVEVRNFSSGCYTLVHDNVDQHGEEGLDVILHLADEFWDESVGGYHTYMDGDKELLTIIPVPNSLSLAFRDVGCMRFVKYANSAALGCHYDVALVVWEDPAKQHDDDDSNDDSKDDGNDDDFDDA